MSTRLAIRPTSGRPSPSPGLSGRGAIPRPRSATDSISRRPAARPRARLARRPVAVAVHDAVRDDLGEREQDVGERSRVGAVRVQEVADGMARDGRCRRVCRERASKDDAGSLKPREGSVQPSSSSVSRPRVRPVRAGAARAASSVPATYGAADEPASWRIESRSSGQPEHHLGRHREARQPQRVDLRAADVAPRASRRARGLATGGATSGGRPAEPLGQLARGAAGRVGLAGVRVVDDLPLGRWRAASSAAACAIAAVSEKLPAAIDADAALARGRVDLRVVVRRQPGRADHDRHAALDRRQRVRLHDVVGGEVDQHVDAVERLGDGGVDGRAGELAARGRAAHARSRSSRSSAAATASTSAARSSRSRRRCRCSGSTWGE